MAAARKQDLQKIKDSAKPVVKSGAKRVKGEDAEKKIRAAEESLKTGNITSESQ